MSRNKIERNFVCLTTTLIWVREHEHSVGPDHQDTSHMKDEDDNTPTSQMEKQLCVSMETLRLRYCRPYQLVGIGHRSR